MSSVFSNNVVTQAGLNLIASATAANPIVYVKALSSPSVPSIPDDESSYLGIDGVIDASSSTDNTARIIARYGNNTQYSPQPVKAIAIMAKLASQSDSQALVFAYCSDANSQIVFPPSSAPSQKTRFAFNITFDGQSTVEVVETGCAALSDLERLVSCHRAGNPNAGDDQQIRGSKTFLDEAVFSDTVIHENTVYLDADILPGQANTYNLGRSVQSRLNNVYVKTLHAGVLIAGDNIPANWNLELGSNMTPEVSTVTGGISTVTLGSGNRRYSGVYANRLDGFSLYLWESNHQEHGVLTYDLSSGFVFDDAIKCGGNLHVTLVSFHESWDPDSAVRTVSYNMSDGFRFPDDITCTGLVSGDIMPSGDQQKYLGKPGKRWLQIYTNDISAQGNVLIGSRIGSGVSWPSTWNDSNSVSANMLLAMYHSNGNNYVVKLASPDGSVVSNRYYMDNMDIGRLGISYIPDPVPDIYEGNLTKVPIGGLVLAFPSRYWATNSGSGRSINPGASITVNRDTNNQWFAAEWDYESGYSIKALSTMNHYSYLEPGTYRALSYLKASGTAQNRCDSPVLLQRVS